MNAYKVTVEVQVAVEAFDEADAIEAVEDCYGQGDYGTHVVQKFVVRNIQEQ
jgi:hypothetical protein